MLKGLLALKFCVLLLGLLLFWDAPVRAQSLVNPVQPQRFYQADNVLRILSQTQVVYLGEQHDSPADHRAQLDIVQALHRSKPQIAIALEMFQRPYQPFLDQYLAGQITETELRQRTEYDQRWGFPWENYAPILRYAKAHNLPLVALNTPAEITRKVAREGFSSLTREDQQWIPPVSEIRAAPAAYRQMLQEIYDQSHQGQGSSSSFENFFLAQVVWDETMAEAIADLLKTNPQRQVVVLAGQGHLVYGYGIPSRVSRRMAQPNFSQRIILLNPPPEIRRRDANQTPVADYFWLNLVE